MIMMEYTVVPQIQEFSSLPDKLFNKHFHSSRFFENLGRKLYVTPTSYLELIRTFETLHQKKVDQITSLRMRYEVGLEKLDFAADQVSKIYYY